MNRFFIGLIIIFWLSAAAYGQESGGIRFFTGNWKELLSLAERSHKPIFVDVYTDWCAPCKRMEREIFVLPEVGEFYNTNFICYRINAEKGDGPDIAKAYGVYAYPTWLYLDGNGALRSRRTDYMVAGEFIESGKAALGKDSISRRLSFFDARFRNGERGLAFLQTYLEMRTALRLDNTEVLNAYVAVRKEEVPGVKEMRFLIQSSRRTWFNAIPLIVGNIQVFEKVEQKEKANVLFDQVLYFAWANAVKAGDVELAKQAWLASEKIYPLFDEARQLTYDHAALFHCRNLRQTEGLKKIGYRMANQQMVVDINFVRQKDKEFLAQVMAPFLSGEQDSTKIPGFAEERQLAAVQYSGKVAGLLYEVAEAFAELLAPDDPSQRDAAIWAERAYLLLPNERTRSLSMRLSARLK